MEKASPVALDLRLVFWAACLFVCPVRGPHMQQSSRQLTCVGMSPVGMSHVSMSHISMSHGVCITS